jgi:glutamyl-tRNA synthetase
MTSPERLRFAPSPTGYLHIGGARTALFNWLYARRHHAVFVLRIEDTDRDRSTAESVQAILDGLRWLGIDWDEGPYFQTERLALYKDWSEKLISQGLAYRCYCTRELLEERRAAFEREKRTYRYEGTCRNLKDYPADKPHVVRFKMPQHIGSLTFTDKVIGKISKEYSDLDDFVILRGDGLPLYNFGAVIDDHTMGITLVGRGQEHINSTFPQLAIYQALGWEVPEFAHFPLILGPDREKLSKRRHPEADVILHARNGILPEALLNFIVRLGWSHGDDEIFSREQMIAWFDFEHIGSTSGVWNPDKLLWVNQHYLKTLPPAVVAQRLVPFLEAKGLPVAGFPRLEGVVVALRARAKTLQEMADMAAYFLTKGVAIDPNAAAKHLTPDSLKLLQEVRTRLASLPDWKAEDIEAVLKAVAEQAKVGLGKIAQPVRVAVTGGTVSPGIGETLELVGRDETMSRLDAGLRYTHQART